MPDLLESGNDRPTRWTAPRWSSLSPRRRRVLGLVLVLAVLLAAGGMYLKRLPPQAPALAVSVDPGSAQLDPVAQLSEGPPGGSTHVELAVAVALADQSWAGPNRSVELLGLDGPGLRATSLLPSAPRLGGPTPTVGALIIGADLDCTAVPLPTPVDGYRLRVLVRDGARQAPRLVPLGAAAPVWAERVQRACTWVRTQQQVSVTAVRASVDPLQPALDLAVTVRNDGPLDAVAWTTGRNGWGDTVDPAVTFVTVASGQSTTVRTRLALSACLSWAQPTLPTSTQETPLPLVASVGRQTTGSPPNGWEPPGVPLTRSAATELQAALSVACGGITTPVAVTVPGQSSYDPQTGTLTARLVVQLPAGRVQQARLVAPPDSASGSLTPLFDSTAWQAPDAAGRLAVTVRFRAMDTQPCLGAPFLVFYLDARVPEPTGDRQLRFAMSTEVAPPGTGAAFLCSD